mmetsp:Transcript_3564/g.7200  ORF Transcript_3564/g.7200 Transcript_3564/m.7200 type:complete len:96 (+) Transcript_3564:408-695(+)
MILFLAQLHSVQLADSEFLAKLSKTHDAYFIRTYKTWTKNYNLAQTHEFKSIQNLMKFLDEQVPLLEDKMKTKYKSLNYRSICHGDFRLDNTVFK